MPNCSEILNRLSSVRRLRRSPGVRMRHLFTILAGALLAAALPVHAAESTPAYGPELQGFAYPHPLRHFRFTSQGQALQMAYMDVAPAGAANGRTAVLMHGKNFCGATWEQTIAALSEAGYRVVVPDQVGFCASTKPANYQYTFQQLAATKLHADDTPIPVLAPGNGKTKTARLWTYVRDDRPSGDTAPAAVWFAYSPDRKGVHPQTHLAGFSGVLQADAYAGFNALYENGTVEEAACWAHARRKFYDLHEARPSALTTEALRRIAELYVIEADIRGKPPDQRRQARQTRAKPLLDDLERWLRAALEKLSRKSDTSAAILYSLNLWPALTRYCDDGTIEIDNSAAE
eukprot:gene38327-47319_t